ncbi:hypothetical protein PR048_011247 [Dryococelus australis]|uniref:Uncharacterized protein n=1 Tax=Dryococelus australis TaxID=614101 RepID=A0ABQ9HLT2_9NEOP|nr:hypothetical protein PR048_011247 [Dryococelus australis]
MRHNSHKTSTSAQLHSEMILLNIVGEAVVEVSNTFNLSDEDRTKYDKVRKMSPRKNVPYERFLLYSRQQIEQEPFQQFEADLKKLVCSCELVVQMDEIVRDCIFIGVRDSALCLEMIRTQDLTLEKACELGRLAETSTKQLQCHQGEFKKTNKLFQYQLMMCYLPRKMIRVRIVKIKRKTLACVNSAITHIHETNAQHMAKVLS